MRIQRLAQRSGTAAVLAFTSFFAIACGGDDPPPDAGPRQDAAAADAGADAGTDAGADGGQAGTLGLASATTGDGQRVIVELSAAPDPATVTAAAFEVVTAQGPAGVAVASAALDGTRVTLELAAPLPRGPEYTVTAPGLRDPSGGALDPAREETVLLGTLHLALIWHQHQPLYLDPQGDYLRGPWVRKHATKDYWDMTALVGEFPDVHLMVNLTPVLLRQIETYYLDRLEPFVSTASNTIDVAGYFAQKTGVVTDPWIDLLLRPTPEPAALTEQERDWYYRDIWSNFSIADALIARFPEYLALRAKRDAAPGTLTRADLLQLKVWFQLAWFDPDFLRGPVTLNEGEVVNLSDLVEADAEGIFRQRRPFTEDDARRLVVEEYKVMKNVVPVHRDLAWDAAARTGQVEVMTTPFDHPILPLIQDTELARIAQPVDPLPSRRMQQEEDARAHVIRAQTMYRRLFGRQVTGMWPAEGSVAEAVVHHFSETGVRWIATDRRVLERSTPEDQPIYSPYRIDADTVIGDGGSADDELAIVFRDTEISDKLGFFYQGNTPEENVVDLRASLLHHAGPYGTDRLLTLILDGENAWEHYRLDHDAKGFLRQMYEMFEAEQELGRLRTVTVTEYLDGNPARGVTAHTTHELPELEPLHAGSWIGASYSTWIGEDEENTAWDYLVQVREDLEGFAARGLTRPDPTVEAPPPPGTPAHAAWRAWQSMYAAEGSDWFWWYGADQTAAGGDQPFDRIFLALLRGVYEAARDFGLADVQVPDFPPILRTCNPPGGELSPPPVIDGRFDPDDGGDPAAANEWTSSGSGVCMDVDSGGSPNPDDDLGVYYHGVTPDAVHLGLRFRENLAAKLGTDYQVRVYFSHKHLVSIDPLMVEQDPFLDTTRAGQPLVMGAGGAAREVTFDFSGPAVTASIAAVSGGAWETPALAPSITAASGETVLEARIPLAALNHQADDPLEMVMVVASGGRELDRAPNSGAIVLFNDRSQLVEVTFVLDATGARLALDAVKPIDNPPPPRGTGTVFIVGNLEAIGNWTPNSVPMADDGVTHGDRVAGDNLWTFRLLLAPRTEVQYKYTIGSMGEGWGPTEEFPLTNRGFEVRDRDGNREVELRDVFADRPDPSGSLGALTEEVDP